MRNFLKYLTLILTELIGFFQNMTGYIEFSLNTETNKIIGIVIIILSSIVLAFFSLSDKYSSDKETKNQKLFNRWIMFLHSSNIQHEDSLRSKDSTDFTPYSELLKQFSLKEIKMLKKNNYFELNFNIEGYELLHSILTLFIEVINKIDFDKIKFSPAKQSEHLLLDSPKEVKP